ncbi:unnamed protein product [Victoria cruziana]
MRNEKNRPRAEGGPAGASFSRSRRSRKHSIECDGKEREIDIVLGSEFALSAVADAGVIIPSRSVFFATIEIILQIPTDESKRSRGRWSPFLLTARP